MRDPARLLDEGATAAELMLLRAGASEEPSDAAARQLLATLGLASGAAIVGATATKSVAAGPLGRGLLAKLAGKWVILSAFGVASGAALVLGRGGSVGQTASLPARAPAPAKNTPQEAVPVAEPAQNSSVVPAGESVAVAAVREDPTTQVAASQAPSRSSPSIAREIAALDVARKKLGHGNPRGALAALDDYDRAARPGVLHQEAVLLRIEALAAAGDRGGARRLAARFLKEHPHSPHETRIRALVGELP